MSSSTSLQQFLVPHLKTSRPSKSHRRPRAAAATSSPAPTATPPPKVSVERLEPRVEEREGGYFVLKEKYRGGINPQEKVKIEKEPIKLVVEDGIRDLATTPMEVIDGAKVTKDDVDVRLKWLGLFHRRKHQCMSLFFLVSLLWFCFNFMGGFSK